MSHDPTNRPDQEKIPETPDQPTTTPETPAETSETKTPESETSAPHERQRILIGSQRNPDAYRLKPKRDWTPIPSPAKPDAPKEPASAGTSDEPTSGTENIAGPTENIVSPAGSKSPENLVADEIGPVADEAASPAQVDSELGASESDGPSLDELAEAQQLIDALGPMPDDGQKFPPPSKRGKLSADLEDEFQQALAGTELEALIAETDSVTRQSVLESGSKQTGRVVAIRREDVFLELGGREQGVVPLRQFEEEVPEIGSQIEVRVARFNTEEGLYELSLTGAAADVGDWDDLEEGMLVEARVTGHNTGGLECEVNHIRGFIPVSQIAIWRVEDLAEFVDEKFTCLVTEVNPGRGNLVLSRRAVLEREKEEARKTLLESLAPGQIHEGVVRKILDFGAFVDIGGVDGLLHISQISWARIKHPTDVLQEGQTIKVRVEKVDKDSGRIGFSFRDLLENPWIDAARKYPPSSTVKGKVTKLMEFGAFVELEPGVEGLVHVSELSHKRVWRPSDVVHEDDEVDVVVLSVDTEAQRIGLSMKQAYPEPEPEPDKESDAAALEPETKPPPRKTPSEPLKGGLQRPSAGEQFGLKW